MPEHEETKSIDRLLRTSSFFANVDNITAAIAVPFKDHPNRDEMLGIGEIGFSGLAFIIASIAILKYACCDKDKVNIPSAFVITLMLSNFLAIVGGIMILTINNEDNSHYVGLGLVALSKVLHPLLTSSVLGPELASDKESSSGSENRATITQSLRRDF